MLRLQWGGLKEQHTKSGHPRDLIYSKTPHSRNAKQSYRCGLNNKRLNTGSQSQESRSSHRKQCQSENLFKDSSEVIRKTTNNVHPERWGDGYISQSSNSVLNSEFDYYMPYLWLPWLPFLFWSSSLVPPSHRLFTFIETKVYDQKTGQEWGEL